MSDIVIINNPSISIIIPIYKVEKYIHQCIDSIISQTFTNWECILVDDGSPDKCPLICDEYSKKDSRIKVIHQKNGGVSTARNAGLNIAQGDYIAFVDSDDWIDKNYLLYMFNSIIDHEVDLIVCGLMEEVENNEYLNKNYNRSEKSIIIHNREDFIKHFCVIRNDLYLASYLHAPINKLYKRSIIKDIIFNTKMRTYEDYVFNLEVFNQVESVCFLSLSLYNYVYNSSSATKYNLDSISKQDLIDAKKSHEMTVQFCTTNKICCTKLNNYFRRFFTSFIGLVIRFKNDNNTRSKLEFEKYILSNISFKLIFTNFWQFKYSIILFLYKYSFTRKLLIFLLKK